MKELACSLALGALLHNYTTFALLPLCPVRSLINGVSYERLVLIWPPSLL